MPKKSLPIPLPLLLFAPSSLSRLQAEFGGVPLPVRAEDYATALAVASRMIAAGDRDKAAARSFVQKLHESTKKHQDRDAREEDRHRTEDRIAALERHVGSLQRAVRGQQAKIDALERELRELNGTTHQRDDSALYSGHNHAGSCPDLVGARNAVVHSRSASASASVSVSIDQRGVTRSDSGHGGSSGSHAPSRSAAATHGIAARSESESGAGVWWTSHSRAHSGPTSPSRPRVQMPSAAAALARSARDKMEILGDVGFDSPEDPFAPPPPGSLGRARGRLAVAAGATPTMPSRSGWGFGSGNKVGEGAQAGLGLKKGKSLSGRRTQARNENDAYRD